MSYQGILENYFHLYIISRGITPTKGVHGSAWVGFVPNPKPICSHRVGGLTTRRRPRTTSIRVRLVSSGQRLGSSKLE